MSNPLTDLRQQIVDGLRAKGFNAHSPLPEVVDVPVVWVVPGDPYLSHEGATFGGYIVRHQVNFAAAPGTNEVAAEALDAMAVEVLDALDALGETDELAGLVTGEVDRIGLADLSGQSYLAGTVNIRTEIRRS